MDTYECNKYKNISPREAKRKLEEVIESELKSFMEANDQLEISSITFSSFVLGDNRKLMGRVNVEMLVK